MAARKAATSRNTAQKTARRGPQRDAATGRVSGGNPGNKGGTGRPPDEWKAALRELVSRPEQLEHVRGVLADPTHPHWFNALKWASEQGYGKAAQSVELTGKDGGPVEIRQRFIIGGQAIDF